MRGGERMGSELSNKRKCTVNVLQIDLDRLAEELQTKPLSAENIMAISNAIEVLKGTRRCRASR